MNTPIYALLQEKPMSLMELWEHFPGVSLDLLHDLVEQMVDSGAVGRRVESRVVYYVKVGQDKPA